MKTDIIKLREAEASSKSSNADFNITLDRPIKMTKGNSLNISKVFLDTITAGGNLIELNEDTTIKMDVARYIMNDQADQLFPNPNNATRMRTYQPAPGGSVDTEGDGQHYFMGKTLNTPADTEKAIKINYNVKTRTNRMVGGLTLKFSYVGIDGTTQHANYRIKREKGTFYKKNGKSFDIGLKMIGKSMSLLNSRDELKNHWIDPDSVIVKYKDGGVPQGEATAQLITKEFSMTIEAGVYTPQQIGVLITDEMTKINYSGPIGDNLAGGAFPVNSPFLGTIVQERLIVDPTGANNNLVFVKSEGTGSFRYEEANSPGGLMITANEDRFVGANEVALEYDENHRKMSFPILHFANYVNESASGNDAVPGVIYEPYGISNKYSGVAFTHLEPSEFWNKLGFENITIDVEQIDTPLPATGGNAAFQPFKVTFTEGKQVTGGFKSLDTPVQKNTNFRQPITTANTKVQSADTIALLGDKIFTNSYENEGYYMIELSMGVRQSLTGGNGDISFNSNKVFGIVGTYYQSNSFTTDDASGIPYIHNSDEEILISDIHVRILNANGSVPPDDLIGESNTVFLALQSQDDVDLQKGKK